jgi:hypothetical protein
LLFAWLIAYCELLIAHRQTHDKLGLHQWLRRERDRAVVRFDNALANGQSQSVAAGIPRAGLIGSEEAFENPRLIGERNAAAGIRDSQHRPILG